MLVFGIVLTMLGAVLPGVMESFGIDKASAGTLFLVMSFGVLAGSLVFGPVVDRYGYKGMLAGAIALVFLGLELIAFAPSLAVLRVGVALIGFGGGIINGGTSALVADISEAGRSAGLSILGIFFGIGAVGVPFSLGLLLGMASYQTLVASVGAVVLVPLIATLVVGFPLPKQTQGLPIAAGAKLVRDPVLLLFGLMLFLESGMEIAVGGWTATFFSEELALSAERSLIVLSLYWLGMMLARFALGTFLRTIALRRQLLGCITLGLIGTRLMLGSRGVTGAAIGTFLLGVGFAATFPVVLSFVGERYPALSGTAFSIVFVMALTGGMIIPWLTGVIGAAHGLRTSFMIIPTALVLLAVMFTLVTRRRAVAPTAS
jgi:fucose permease